ncbi:MAG: acetyl-CoA carboxylase biotin carboxyl carrier protein [Ruminococcus sp.]|nr:acetyl-CoA carboxylase biotin carboxyl carrier protein [Ruminococcus sp.]
MSYFFNDDGNNLDTLKTLMELVSKNKLSKLEINEGDLNIKIEGRPCPPPPPMPPMNAIPPMPPQGNPAPMPIPNSNSANDVKVETSAITGNVVKAPIVGTFYASPAPNKPPYVNVGDIVKKGDVIMIIESMKLMNEVTSEFDGTVKKIMVQDGTPVEYDQPIMIIE